MKALAFIPLLALIGIAGLLGGMLLSFVFPSKSEAASSGGPWEIGITAWQNIPWADLYDLFLGGVFGVAVWLSRYVILPFMNWAGTQATGKPVVFDIWWAYLVLVIVMLVILWGTKERLYSFLTTNIIRVGAIVGAVFIIGVILKLMNVI